MNPTTSADTRQRIIDAAMETVRREGIVGTSARAIARTGGFNQALIFYHFGSVNDALLAGLDCISDARMARYREQLAEVSSLPQLVEVAAGLHAEDVEHGHIHVLSQMLAGASSSPELAVEVLRRFEPWTEMVVVAIRRVVQGTPYEQLVPVDDLAFVISALFVGIELMTHLDPDRAKEQSLFATIGLMARLLEGVLGRPAGGGKKS